MPKESRQFLGFASPDRDCQRKSARSIPLERGVQSVSLHSATQRSNAEEDVAATAAPLNCQIGGTVSAAEPLRQGTANATLAI